MAMPKRKRKIHPVDQLSYMQAHGEPPTELNFKTSPGQHVMLDIRNFYTYLDHEESFQMLRALHRAATVQFGKDFHDRVQRYLDTVHIIGG
jgi:hypothetical protein